MFAPLLDGIRADIDRQIGWAKAEVRRQTRYRALIAVVASMAALAHSARLLSVSSPFICGLRCKPVLSRRLA
jgi:hypothetical protein